MKIHVNKNEATVHPTPIDEDVPQAQMVRHLTSGANCWAAARLTIVPYSSLEEDKPTSILN